MKVIEQIETYRSEIRKGDLVDYREADDVTNPARICVVVDEGTEGLHRYTIVDLASGNFISHVSASDIRLHRGSVRICNED